MFGLFKGNEVSPEERKNMTLVVNKARCPQNHACPSINVCPVDALKQNGFAAPTVDQEKCIKCGKCVNFCPMRAISLQ